MTTHSKQIKKSKLNPFQISNRYTAMCFGLVVTKNNITASMPPQTHIQINNNQNTQIIGIPESLRIQRTHFISNTISSISSSSAHNPADQHQHCRHQTDSKGGSAISISAREIIRGLSLSHGGSPDVASELICSLVLKQHPPSNAAPSGVIHQRHQQLDVDRNGFSRSIEGQERE